mmetsp:Transcript_20538/g.44916  ORF Transcript_20538/g.44916 Transcript_20538/m.44916 type:complete len:408 (-) Transcript_20538:8-1231(-)
MCALQRETPSSSGIMKPLAELPESDGVTSIDDGKASLPDIDVEQIAARMAEAIEVGDLQYRSVKYERCFVGSDAVRWMLGSGLVTSEAAAVALGNQMTRLGLVQHVLNEHVFENKNLFYRFPLDRQELPGVGRKTFESNRIEYSTAEAPSETVEEESQLTRQREQNLERRVSGLEAQFKTMMGQASKNRDARCPTAAMGNPGEGEGCAASTTCGSSTTPSTLDRLGNKEATRGARAVAYTQRHIEEMQVDLNWARSVREAGDEKEADPVTVADAKRSLAAAQISGHAEGSPSLQPPHAEVRSDGEERELQLEPRQGGQWGQGKRLSLLTHEAPSQHHSPTEGGDPHPSQESASAVSLAFAHRTEEAATRAAANAALRRMQQAKRAQREGAGGAERCAVLSTAPPRPR